MPRTRNSAFTEDEIAHCKEAMVKSAPVEALQLIASGRAIVEMTADRRDIYIESLDGRVLRDPDHPDRKMLLSGAWPLYRAGMIDEFCLVTPEGYATLKSI